LALAGFGVKFTWTSRMMVKVIPNLCVDLAALRGGRRDRVTLDLYRHLNYSEYSRGLLVKSKKYRRRDKTRTKAILSGLKCY